MYSPTEQLPHFAAPRCPRRAAKPPSMTAVFINGKFLAQAMTGVQRFAGEIVRALDARLAASPGGPVHYTLLCPPQARRPPLRCIGLREVSAGPVPLHVWEQLALPLAARSGWLLNLAGAAPLAGLPRQLCTLHDAAVFDHPEAYTPAFGRWYRFLFRAAARRAGALLTVSAFSRTRLAERLGVDPRRLAVVGEGEGLAKGIALAKKIASKYVSPPHTTDFAVLFVPTEGLFAEVCRIPGMVEALQNDFRVVVAGPTTLSAMLNSLRLGFRTLAIEKRSSEVWNILSAVKTEFRKFGDIVDATHKSIDAAAKKFGDIGVRSRAIERKLRDVEELPGQAAAPLVAADVLGLDDPETD